MIKNRSGITRRNLPSLSASADEAHLCEVHIVLFIFHQKETGSYPTKPAPRIKSKINFGEVSMKKPAFDFQASAGGVGMTGSRSNFFAEYLKRLKEYFELFNW